MPDGNQTPRTPTDPKLIAQTVFWVEPIFRYRAVVQSVYDGDTIRAERAG